MNAKELEYIGLGKYICVFCGKTADHNTEPCKCSQSLQYHSLDKRIALDFIESNKNIFVEKTGKKTYHVFDNKQDHIHFLNEKQKRRDDNANFQKRMREEFEARNKEFDKIMEEERRERIRLEGLRCLSRDTILKNLTLKEMIDELKDIINRYRNEEYDEYTDDSYKQEGIITFEELSSYIQDHYDELIDAEIAERERQVALDE